MTRRAPALKATLSVLLLLGLAQPGQGAPASWPTFTYAHGPRPAPPRAPGEATLLELAGPAGPIRLTLKQLQALPAVRYATLHRQLQRTFTYQGVTLRDLAVRGGFAGRDLRVYASNGYFTTVLARDYMNDPIMLAYSADNRPISPEAKGPLTVVLPPQPARYHSAAYSAAWVWFAERITPVK